VSGTRSTGGPLDLDGRSLRYFVVVAEELNFTRAAARLHVAQQTLSDSVRHLEALIGVQLLDRSPRSVTLTAGGRRFLESARSILAESETAVLAAQRAQRLVAGTLVVGTPDWPSGIQRFRSAIDRVNRVPEITIEVSLLSWLEHPDAVRAGSIDVGVTFVPSGDRPPESLAGRSLGVERANCFVVASGHRLATLVTPEVADLVGCRLLLIDRERSPALHDHLVDGLRSRGVEPDLDRDRASQLSFSAAMTHAELHGSAVWAVKSMTESLPPGVTAVEIPGLDLDVELMAIWRADDEIPAVRVFVDALAAT